MRQSPAARLRPSSVQSRSQEIYSCLSSCFLPKIVNSCLRRCEVLSARGRVALGTPNTQRYVDSLFVASRRHDRQEHPVVKRRCRKSDRSLILYGLALFFLLLET